MKAIKLLLIVTLIIGSNLCVYSQSQTTSVQETHQSTTTSFDLMPKRSDFNTWSVGVNFGPSFFYGTVTSQGYYKERPINDPGFLYGLTLKKSITPLFGIEGEFDMGQLKGKNSMFLAKMKTDVHYDWSLNATFTLGNFTWFSRNHKVNLRGSFGTGQINFQPNLQSDMKQTKANPYNVIFPVVTPDTLHTWVGLGNTSEYIFPLSIAALYDLSQHFNLMLRYRYTVALGSKLDYTWNPLIYHQSYAMLSLGVIYNFGKKEKHIDWVNPIGDIYSQVANLDRKIQGISDTVRTQLTSMQKEIDSLGKAVDIKLNDFSIRIDTLTNRITNVSNSVTNIYNTFNTNNTTINKSDLNLLSIYFPTNISEIQPDSKKNLADVAIVLKNNPDKKLMITGNCDARGDAAFNLRLGKKRADATKKFLVTEYGIDESRLFTESKGKNDLLDPKELDVNRRVDFKFIKDK